MDYDYTLEDDKLEKVRVDVFAVVEAVRTGQGTHTLHDFTKPTPYMEVYIRFPVADRYLGEYDIVKITISKKVVMISHIKSHGYSNISRHTMLEITDENRTDCEMFERMMRTATRQDSDEADTKPARAL